ncbi:MAG: response regulator transcription factor [Chloroflexi bacterium]|nr:response regulator transcription factor [Chloroflexota bacterium]
MIRVALADDHTLFRQGLRQLLELEPDMEVVGEAVDGMQARELARRSQPDVFLIDINMPVIDGVAATRAIVEDNPAVGVIMLTMCREDGYIVRAVTAGARGYLLKDADSSRVIDAVRTVAAGQSQIDPNMTTKLLHEFRRIVQTTGEDAARGGLTRREVELLRLIASGCSNKEIAHELKLAESTIKNKLSVLFQKVDVKDRTQAAIYAMSHGLLLTADQEAESA